MEGLIPLVYRAIMQQKEEVPSGSPSYVRLPTGDSGRFQASDINIFRSNKGFTSSSASPSSTTHRRCDSSGDFNPVTQSSSLSSALMSLSSSTWHQRLGHSGDEVLRSLVSRVFLFQKKYVMELFKRAHMLNYNPNRTLVDTESKLGPEGTPNSDHSFYRSLAGGLQYLTVTRPDLSYVVQQICLYMHDPREPHLAALKRILRNVQGTLEFGLQLYAAEAEGVANVVAEMAWLRNLLRELYTPLLTATFVYCDNVSAVYLSANPVQHQRTKHIEIDIHFVRNMIAMGHVRVFHIPSRY
uniref:Ribonuclease H-like domain-containing protein n=1 Tax=Tanacetum cinerariifolium TaxID=118510 RepID=A0A6L2LR41_TANCI|nr:ribonuclease H-like domain-containing protein [Tanacetum cinerariifolium]